MKLYHSPLSSNARRVVMTALELGRDDVELVPVDLAQGAQRQPEFLRLNPNGKVPVLVDDDFVLWESNAIVQYLADKTPNQTLYPTELRARADVNRWLAWCAAQLSPAVATLNWEHFIKPMMGLGAPEPALVQQGEAGVKASVAVLDAHLKERSYLVGDALTLADLSLAPVFMYEKLAQLPLGEAKHLRAWLARIEARDSWKKTAIQLPG